jgi:hypothetical protein
LWDYFASAAWAAARRADKITYTFGPDGRPVRDYGKNFRPHLIGQAAYNRGNASLSRAVRRLVERGLLRRTYGRHLTDAGRELVRTWGVEPVAVEDGPTLEQLADDIRAIRG